MKKAFAILLMMIPNLILSQEATLVYQVDKEDQVISDLTTIGDKLYFSSGGHYYPKGAWCGNSHITKTYHPKAYYFDFKTNKPKEVILEKLDTNFISRSSFYNMGEDKLVIVKEDRYGEIYLTNTNLSSIEKVNKINGDAPASIYRTQRIGDKLFFNADDPRGKRQLWFTDGTMEGTRPFYNDTIPYMISTPTPFKDGLVFMGYNQKSDWVLYYKPYESEELTKFTLFPESSVFVKIKDTFDTKMIFGVTYRNKKGSHDNKDFPLTALWETDGTIDGTKLIGDFGKYELTYSPTQHKGKFYLSVGYHTYYLWETDGTREGTKKTTNEIRLSDGNSGAGLIKFKDDLYFIGERDSTSGRQIYYLSDNSEPILVSKRKSNQFNPMNLTVINDKLFFIANTKKDGRELWKVDSKKKKIYQITKINNTGKAFSEDKYRQPWFPRNDKLYFLAQTPDGSQLFATDGKKYFQLIAQNGLEAPREEFFSHVEYNGELYVTYGKGLSEYGYQIWKIKE
jgi:ELWxxDGT repeat protein